MAQDYTANRQTAHLNAAPAEINRRFAALESAFGAAWLNAGAAPLQSLWQRKDALAVNQLFLLGDAVEGLSVIDHPWVTDHVGKIKSNDLNNRRGSMFELLGVNLFRRPVQTIRPTKVAAAGFDAVLSMPDAARIDMSLKSYGTSAHEQFFNAEASRTETAFMDALSQYGRNGAYLGAIASSYPSKADWEALRGALPDLIANPPPRGQLQRFGNAWSTAVLGLPPQFGPYSNAHLSYQVFMLAPFHPNESKNLFDKFEDACANARKHAKSGSDVARLVLMRIPETISLVACDQWTKDFVRDNSQVPIDGIYLYQLTVADMPNGQTALSHALAANELQSFKDWRSPVGKPRRVFSINYPVGIISMQPTRRQIVGGAMPLQLDDGYVYQRGNLFKMFKFDPNGVTNLSITNIASGIVQHAVVEDAGGQQMVLSGYFPPLKEITLFD